jgi:hypothetical protein
MTRGGQPVLAEQLAASYETLRAAVLGGRSHGQPGLAVIVHRGLTAWVAEKQWDAPSATASATTPGPSVRSAPSASTPDELTRVLAGIIVALATGGPSAHA